MSYAQFLVEDLQVPTVCNIDYHQCGRVQNQRCVQETVELIEHLNCHRLSTPEHHWPEHRADEARTEDPVFDNSPDTFQPAPEDLTPLQQIEFQDLYKKSGRVIGRHDAVVDMPWYLTQQFVSKKLKCSPQEASELIDALKALDADKDVVLDAIEHAKGNGIQFSINYYQELSSAMQALNVSDEDAMEHRNTEGFAHVESYGSCDTSAEWAMLLEEGVPSAASIAHSLGISLEDAGDIRQDMILQDMDSAGRKAEVAVEDSQDDDEPDLDDDDKDSVGFVSEGWHLMDDVDDYGPSWIDMQPYDVQNMFYRIDFSETLKELKSLGQQVYSLTSWSQSQRTAFWSAWNARRNAILSQTEERILKVRKGVQRVLSVGTDELPRLGKKLFDLTKEKPDFYSPEGWARIWETYKSRKGQISAKPLIDRQAMVEQFLKVHAG